MIVGLLPMGGQGTRLAQPTPKPLMPTITEGGIVPLYRHALEQLGTVTAATYALSTPASSEWIARLGLPYVETIEKDLAGAFGVAGRYFAALYGEDTWVAMAFPDSIWHLDDGRSLKDALEAARADGALALFDAGADELDTVTLEDDHVAEVVTKQAGATGRVRGWGAFIVRASALATMTAEEKDGPQLGRLDLGWAFLGSYVDLGTPERYIAAHDQREGTR